MRMYAWRLGQAGGLDADESDLPETLDDCREVGGRFPAEAVEPNREGG